MPDEHPVVDKPPWPWRGLAWFMAAISLFFAWGWTQRYTEPDVLIVEFFARPGAREALLGLWALFLANAIPLITLLMGVRFWKRESETPEYRTQAGLIIATALLSGVVIIWCVVGRAIALSTQNQSGSTSELSSATALPDIAHIAQTMNKNLPIQLDADTRLLGAMAIGQTLHIKYQYTTLRAAEIDVGILRAEAREQSVRAACTDPGTRELLDAGLLISKSYVDRDHSHLATYDVKGDDCTVDESGAPYEADQQAGEMFSELPPDKVAELAASAANAAMPAGTMLREGLVIEGAGAQAGHILYSYRFQYSKEDVDPQWVANMPQELRRGYCEKLSALADAGVTAEWRYLDSKGALVLSVTAEPASCHSRG